MRKQSTRLDTIRMILVLALVLFVSLIFTNIIGGPVITALVYLFWQSRRRVKYLESNPDGAQKSSSIPPSTVPPSPEPPTSPTSTDA